MAWNRNNPKTTKHTCGGPVFGKKTPGCSRCDELLAGAAPVVWGPSRKEQDAERARAIRMHDCKASGCAAVCTAFDW